VYRLRRLVVLVGGTLVVLGGTQAAARPDVSAYQRPEAAIFYYPWYGTPRADGAYAHWTQRGATPPVTIASAFYPARGVYSSSDARVVAAHMDDIAYAGVQTVIASWWGPGSAEDKRLDLVLHAARARGLRVAAHIEPYQGRTAATVAADITSLRARGLTDFYVYDSPSEPDADWAVANSHLTGVRVFANTSLVGKAAKGGFAGLYTYDVYLNNGSSFRRICGAARRLNLICAPSVGPGYDAVSATGDPRTRPRLAGARYDSMWMRALASGAPIVTITSYNEWHEGTQIEPARSTPGYESYDGAYRLKGATAESAYLERTRMWVWAFTAPGLSDSLRLLVGRWSAFAAPPTASG
jgi:glycoprotein endo-alpha-1,2-mannosidase